VRRQVIISAVVAGAVLAYAAPAYASTVTQLAVTATGTNGGFGDVTAVSGSDGWAVGSGNLDGMVQRYNGTRWTRVTTPSLLDGSTTAIGGLSGVDATSASNALAVGSRSDLGTSTGVALRWNGTSWSRLAVPATADPNTDLMGVKAFSATDAWAIGESWSSGGSRRSTVALHYNGTSWTQFATPSPGTRNNDVTAIDGSAADDVWAVGYSLDLPYGNRFRKSMILHWNGSAWSQVASPNSDSTYLYDVVAVSRTDAWAVGFSSTGTGGSYVLHWNGTAWTSVTPPPISGVSSVTARSSSDVWVAGSDAAGADGIGQPRVAHWNGTAWTVTAVTVSGGTGAPWLSAVTVADAGTELAVGYQSDNTTGASAPIAFRVAG
jgi:hypothetical protein